MTEHNPCCKGEVNNRCKLFSFLSRTEPSTNEILGLTYLSIAENFEHVCVKRFNGLVVTREDLLLDGAQVERVGHFLIILTIPGGTQIQRVESHGI